MIEEAVLEMLQEEALSGADLIERLRARDAALVEGKTVAVYGVLADLGERGLIERLSETPGEVVWGMPGTRSRPARPAGLPESFGLAAEDLRLVSDTLAKTTRGLPTHLFEELRRVVVADADRRANRGASSKGAARAALDALGRESSVRRLLRGVLKSEQGLPLVAAPKRRRRWLVALVAIGALIVVVRFFVLGVYNVPTSSMAPALAPEANGGDRRVLVYRLAYLFGGPVRGDIVVFLMRGGEGRVVKRVMGLPGESISIKEPDLFIDAERLVKERALLERVGVPLFDESGFDKSDGGRFWLQREPLHSGYRRPDGVMLPLESDRKAAVDTVLRFRIRAPSAPCTVEIRIDDGAVSPHTVVLSTDRSVAFAAVGGREIAKSADFVLEPGFWRDVWITNADRVVRVEIDGKEAARAAAPRRGARRGTVCSLRLDGAPAEIADLRVLRDLIYENPTPGGAEWTLAPDEFFLLGDNSPSSRDSRYHGPVKRDRLEGRAFAVIFPLDRRRFLK